jgi:WD40 repeat protein
MTPTILLPARGDLSGSISRVYGSQPFHTDGDLLALRFAPDGALWSVEEPGVLRQWNVASKKQADWHQLEELATLWCFNATAELAAAGSDELSIWHTASGDLCADWPAPCWVTALAFHPDSRHLATGHDDGIVRLWDVRAQQLVRAMTGHNSSISALAFSEDGSRLASAGEDRAIHLWQVASGQRAGSLLGHTDRIPALAWHPDGQRLVSAGWDTTARVWDVTTCEPIILLNSHAGQVLALAFNRDGSLLACADSAHAVHVWYFAQYQTLRVLRGQSAEVRTLAFHPDGHRLAAGGADRVIHLWDVRQRAEPANPPDPRQSRSGIGVSPDGSRLASLGAATELRVWEAATAKPALALANGGALRAFAASPNGRWFAASLVGDQEPIASAEPDLETLGLWDATTGEKRTVLEGQAAPITALAFSPDSSALASAGCQSGDVWIWDVPEGGPALLIPDAVDACVIEALAFHPRGRVVAVGGIDWLATGGDDGQVTLWDIPGRRPVASFLGGVTALSFHPNGQRLATATLVQTVRVWDVVTARLLAELTGHLDAVSCVGYSPDGRWLASGSDDRTIRLWDATTGSLRGAMELDTQIKALCFSPDGRLLYTGNANGSCYQVEVSRVLTGSV